MDILETMYLILLLVVLPWGGLALHLWALFNTLKYRFAGSQKALWIFMNLCIPIIGPLLYVFFGRKERRERIQTASQQIAAATVSLSSDDTRLPQTTGTIEKSMARWIQPVVLSLLLVLFEEQGILSALIGMFLLFIYLPMSFGERFKPCRSERLTRFAIYLSAVLVVFGLRVYNTSLAKERAAAVIAAVAAYKAKTGAYPERLEQLVPEFIPEIPAKAKMTFLDSGFKYFARTGSHTLSYVSLPPFERRVYDFETGKWSHID